MYRMCGFLSRDGLDMLPIDVVGLQGGPTRTVRLAAQHMTCRQVQLKLHVLIIIFTLIMILKIKTKRCTLYVNVYTFCEMITIVFLSFVLDSLQFIILS